MSQSRNNLVERHVSTVDIGKIRQGTQERKINLSSQIRCNSNVKPCLGEPWSISRVRYETDITYTSSWWRPLVFLGFKSRSHISPKRISITQTIIFQLVIVHTLSCKFHCFAKIEMHIQVWTDHALSVFDLSFRWISIVEISAELIITYWQAIYLKVRVSECEQLSSDKEISITGFREIELPSQRFVPLLGFWQNSTSYKNTIKSAINRGQIVLIGVPTHSWKNYLPTCAKMLHIKMLNTLIMSYRGLE